MYQQKDHPPVCLQQTVTAVSWGQKGTTKCDVVDNLQIKSGSFMPGSKVS